MKNNLNKIIVVSLNKIQLELIETFLEKNGVSKYNRMDNSKSGDIAVRIYKTGEKSKYIINSSYKYIEYYNSGMKPYSTDRIMSWTDFRDEFLVNNTELNLNVKTDANEKVGCVAKPNYPETPKVVSIESYPNSQEYISPVLYIESDKVIEAYKKTTNLDIKQLLKILFGKALFEETFYKVGNRFKHNDKVYTIAKINHSVITFLDENMENFCASKPVQDPYKITEAELKNILGIYFDKFTLIK